MQSFSQASTLWVDSWDEVVGLTPARSASFPSENDTRQAWKLSRLSDNFVATKVPICLAQAWDFLSRSVGKAQSGRTSRTLDRGFYPWSRAAWESSTTACSRLSTAVPFTSRITREPG